jgi:hypothetical protein
MRKYTYIGLFALLCLTSCKLMTKIYYNDHSKVDDGEIWGSNLNGFFVKSENIIITSSSSVQLRNELRNVKAEIIKNGEVILKDDQYYDYALITKSGDTLFLNSAFEIWRYQNKKSKLPGSKVSKYLKAP